MTATPEFKGLDPQDSSDAEFLRNLQGGILKGHGRNYSAQVFLRFKDDISSIGVVLAWLAALPLTSAYEQFQQAVIWKRQGAAALGSLFCSLSLSATGYKKLGLSKVMPRDVGFRGGSKGASSSLNDPNPGNWEPFFQKDVDAMVVLASNDPDEPLIAARDLVAALVAVYPNWSDYVVEEGKTLRNLKGWPIEHFGFVDGIEQPLFFKDDIAAYISENPSAAWDASGDPMVLVLVRDSADPQAFGSYVAFRKLEQDVDGFRASIATVAALASSDPELIAAQVMGRFRDGTPLVQSPQPVAPTYKPRNIEYVGDSAGQRCPFHSHIRKTNPRASEATSRQRRISRRGVSYGDPSSVTAKASRGLLFMCYQQDIGRQFEFLQRQWASSGGFPLGKGIVGIDAVIGQVPASAKATEAQLWGGKWGQPLALRVRALMAHHTSLKAAEYLYTPPISFVRSLA